MNAPTKAEIDELQKKYDEYLRVPQYKGESKEAIINFFHRHHNYLFHLLRFNLQFTETTEPHRIANMEESAREFDRKRRLMRGF